MGSSDLCSGVPLGHSREQVNASVVFKHGEVSYFRSLLSHSCETQNNYFVESVQCRDSKCYLIMIKLFRWKSASYITNVRHFYSSATALSIKTNFFCYRAASLCMAPVFNHMQAHSPVVNSGLVFCQVSQIRLIGQFMWCFFPSTKGEALRKQWREHHIFLFFLFVFFQNIITFFSEKKHSLVTEFIFQYHTDANVSHLTKTAF